MLSCIFCEIFKNTFFEEHMWTTASIYNSYSEKLCKIYKKSSGFYFAVKLKAYVVKSSSHLFQLNIAKVSKRVFLIPPVSFQTLYKGITSMSVYYWKDNKGMFHIFMHIAQYIDLTTFTLAKNLKFFGYFSWAFFSDFEIFTGDYTAEEKSVPKTLSQTRHEYLMYTIKFQSCNLGLVKLAEFTSKSFSFGKFLNSKFTEIREFLAIYF